MYHSQLHQLEPIWSIHSGVNSRVTLAISFLNVYIVSLTDTLCKRDVGLFSINFPPLNPWRITAQVGHHCLQSRQICHCCAKSAGLGINKTRNTSPGTATATQAMSCASRQHTCYAMAWPECGTFYAWLMWSIIGTQCHDRCMVW